MTDERVRSDTVDHADEFRDAELVLPEPDEELIDQLQEGEDSWTPGDSQIPRPTDG